MWPVDTFHAGSPLRGKPSSLPWTGSAVWYLPYLLRIRERCSPSLAALPLANRRKTAHCHWRTTSRLRDLPRTVPLWLSGLPV